MAMGPPTGRDDARDSRPPDDHGVRQDRGRGPLQLERPPGRVRAAGDGLCPGSHRSSPTTRSSAACSSRSFRAATSARSTRSCADPALPYEFRPLLAERADVTLHLAAPDDEPSGSASTQPGPPGSELMSPRHPPRPRPRSERLVRSILEHEDRVRTAKPSADGALPAEPHREHLGEARPPQAGGRRHPVRRRLSAHCDEEALSSDGLRLERDRRRGRPESSG